ncbi:RICIN domain-containing protein [Streptomyces pratensis]|uniref:RICIN domain-containing protein n=1 Tax=Streptomyces pratensis TaxID=1169025 RepID=UPI001EE4ABBF|nr:RICIN domain-containing protein [Streptomyces pratensis]
MEREHDPSNRIPPRSGTSAGAGSSESSPVAVRRAVTMRGAAGDPGDALTPGGGQRGRTNASSPAVTPDTAARPDSPAAGQVPAAGAPTGDGPESTAPGTGRAPAGEATGPARGIGAPASSAEGETEPAASASGSSATSAAAVSAASAAPATVSTEGSSPDAATAAAAPGSGGSGAGSHADGDPPGSRPKKPMLAAAGIVGALLIAVPLLLAGQDDREPDRPRTENAAGTVLDTERSSVPDTYTSKSPVPSTEPSKQQEKKKEKEKEREEEPPAPVVRKQTVAPTPSASKSPKATKKAVVKELTAAEKLRQWANGRSGVQNTVLKNAVTGQCVDIGGYGKGAINAPVNQYPCNATTGDNQLWNLDIVDKDGGPQNAPLFLIRNSKDGLCLDLGYYKARSAGTKVGEFHCSATGDNQLWWLDPRGDGTNWIRNAVSNDLCLRPTGGASAGNDARLVIEVCGYGDRWVV